MTSCASSPSASLVCAAHCAIVIWCSSSSLFKRSVFSCAFRALASRSALASASALSRGVVFLAAAAAAELHLRDGGLGRAGLALAFGRGELEQIRNRLGVTLDLL